MSKGVIGVYLGVICGALYLPFFGEGIRKSVKACVGCPSGGP